MGVGYLLKCDVCQYSVETSGPWEFYRDYKGRRHEYGHPCPKSEEAEQRGIYGLFGELYCPKCDKVVNVVLVEFTEPISDSYKVWSGRCEPKDIYKKEDAVKCPKCKNTHLILSPDNDHPQSCPKCKRGSLIGSGVYIS